MAEIGGYVAYSGYGFAPRMAMQLTQKGIELAQNGRLETNERQLVYQEDPHAAFVARQFKDEDEALFQYLQQSVLAPIGIRALDGRSTALKHFAATCCGRFDPLDSSFPF